MIERQRATSEPALLQNSELAEWAVVLDVEQRHLVGRRFTGPARISGPAGTGKTVVRLHRLARHLRRHSGQALRNCIRLWWRRQTTAASRTPTSRSSPEPGSDGGSIKVGTVHRAQGPEFFGVFYVTEPPPEAESGADLERLRQWQRQLMVAITRGRDHAWVGLVRR